MYIRPCQYKLKSIDKRSVSNSCEPNLMPMNKILCCKHKVEHGKSAVSFFILNLAIATTFAMFLGNNCTTFNNPSAVSL